MIENHIAHQHHGSSAKLLQRQMKYSSLPRQKLYPFVVSLSLRGLLGTNDTYYTASTFTAWRLQIEELSAAPSAAHAKAFHSLTVPKAFTF